MARATLEKVLKDVYGVRARKLSKMISEFQDQGNRKPDAVPPHTIDRIRIVANAIAHVEMILDELPEIEAKLQARMIDHAFSNLEREVAATLNSLRKLIEEAPPSDPGAAMPKGESDSALAIEK